MLIHNITPCSKGFKPTLRSVSRVSEAPIKNSDSVMRCLASLLTAPLNMLPALAAVSPISEALLKMYVLNNIATINHTIMRGTHLYQGFEPPSVDAANDLRKKKGVTNAKTTIHRARVRLMVVAT